LTIDQALLVSGTLRVLKQVEPLRKLFETRQRLSDLLTKLDGNDALEVLLQEGATDNNSLQELKDQVGSNDAADGEESA
jgi:type VI secretion system protein ImpB